MDDISSTVNEDNAADVVNVREVLRLVKRTAIVPDGDFCLGPEIHEVAFGSVDIP